MTLLQVTLFQIVIVIVLSDVTWSHWQMANVTSKWWWLVSHHHLIVTLTICPWFQVTSLTTTTTTVTTWSNVTWSNVIWSHVIRSNHHLPNNVTISWSHHHFCKSRAHGQCQSMTLDFANHVYMHITLVNSNRFDL